DAAVGAAISTFTDAAGIAEIRVTMPSSAGSRHVEIAGASLLEACRKGSTDPRDAAACDAATKKAFTVGSVPPATLTGDRLIATGKLFDRPVAIALGEID